MHTLAQPQKNEIFRRSFFADYVSHGKEIPFAMGLQLVEAFSDRIASEALVLGINGARNALRRDNVLAAGQYLDIAAYFARRFVADQAVGSQFKIEGYQIPLDSWHQGLTDLEHQAARVSQTQAATLGFSEKVNAVRTILREGFPETTRV